MKDNTYNFTGNLKELEEITTWFESDSVDLDQALSKYERGMTLAAELKQHLAEVENRVEKIKQKFDAPKAQTPEPEVSEDSLELFNE
jgi:exodeoxyribonuclease VII small subunit